MECDCLNRINCLLIFTKPESMKYHYLHIILLVISLISYNNHKCIGGNNRVDNVYNQIIHDSTYNSIPEKKNTRTIHQYEITEFYSAHSEVDFSLLGLHLTADSGNLMHDVEFYASTLQKETTALLDRSMVNLTGGSFAYRLLPHGEHFSLPAILELAYDPHTLPIGYQPNDIYTYYYDEHNQRWVQLERVAVDTINHIVLSETTHFTDFINAVIQVPEIPELSTFIPTQLAEMDSPHPLVGVPVIPTPEANAYGTAELTYPINIPAGRNGIQPMLDLHYSSANGNGMLGYGWTMSMPAITIDTRWGVPRYDSDYETEIYTLDGSQLVQIDGNPDLKLPYQTATHLPRSTGDVTFMMRNIYNTDRVVRHGDDPSKYWWTVTSSDGTIRYYGRYAQADYNECVLYDDQGNIGYWALAEVVDVHGNFMRYEYTIDTKGNEIYPKNIYYTGHYYSSGYGYKLPSYRVFFHYREHDDAPSNGRLGFLQQTDSLLCYIDVANLQNDDTQVPITNHRYIIHYHDSLPERQITKINDFPYTSNNAWPTTGDCYSDINGWIYGPIVNSCVDFRYYHPGPNEMFGPAQVLSDTITLTESKSTNFNVGGTATVGIGFNYVMTSLSAGGNYNYAHSKSRTTQMLLDINGDGLSDMVYIQDNTICYRLQRLTNDSTWFESARTTGIPARGLADECSNTHTVGLQANAGFDSIMGAHISGGASYTESHITSYFADVNGDGLPDYIDNDKIYFNRINAHQDFLCFSGDTIVVTDSTQCTTYFYYDGQAEVIPNYTIRDTIVSTYTYHEPDCTPGNYGSYNEEIIPPVLDTWECDGCTEALYEYIRGGYCPIDLHLQYGIPEIYTSRSRSSESTAPAEPEIPRIGGNVTSNLEEYVIHCLRYCDKLLICDECLDLYYDAMQNGENDPSFMEQLSECVIQHGCRRLCSECVGYLIAGDEDAYLACADTFCLGGSLSLCGGCDDQYRDICLDDIEYGRECIHRDIRYNPCIECQDQCIDDPYLCNQCKRDNNCKGSIPDACLELYLNNNYPDADYACGDCIIAHGAFCPECENFCLQYPEKCFECIKHHCYYSDTYAYRDECIANSYAGYTRWKNLVLNQYPTAVIYQKGNKYEAHVVDTIYADNVEPEIEAVRVWVAPKSGQISLSNTIQLLQDTSESRRHARFIDGVRCIIQHNQGISVQTDSMGLQANTRSILSTIKINANDYSIHTRNLSNIKVQKGDIFFFHLMSGHSHLFDNVDWQQTIIYNDGAQFSSVDDFTCSSEEVFQKTSSGTLSLEIEVECISGNRAQLTIYNASEVEIIDITSSTPTIERSISYTADSLFYMVLSPIEGNLGAIEVRAQLNFTPTIVDSINQPFTTWLIPHLSFTRTDTLPSVYFDLFGPLYRGWGQFAYNNTTASELVPVNSLRNGVKEHVEYIFTNNSEQDSVAYVNAITSIVNDSTRWQQLDGLIASFDSVNMYNPTEGDWVKMSADASTYRWEAYGHTARSGRSLMSNTRDMSAMVSSLGVQPIINTTQIEWTTYDSDVPVGQGQRVTTVHKTANTIQWNVNAGVGFEVEEAYSFNQGKTKSTSDYIVTTDYTDMNGDGFPDIVRPDVVQYTNPWGGLGESKSIEIGTHKNYSETTGQSISGGYAYSKKIADGKLKSSTFSTHVLGGGANGSTTVTNSKSLFSYMDVNGDGLPDKLEANGDSVNVFLNLGYKFSKGRKLADVLHIDKSYSDGGGIGLNGSSSFEDLGEIIDGNLLRDFSGTCQLSITLGVDVSGGQSRVDYRLMDMDGNGLPDIVQKTNNGIYIRFIMPHGVANSASVNNCAIQQTQNTSWALNAGFTVGFPIFAYVKMNIGLNGSPIGQSYSKSNYEIIDVNGDGLPDIVWRESSKTYVRYNQMGRKRLLKRVSNTTSQVYELDYMLSEPSTEQRGRKWVLSELRNIIPQNGMTSCDTMAYRYVYADPNYDQAERTNMGYGMVETQEMRTDTFPYRTYRKHKRHYNNTDFINRGQLIYEALTDANNVRYTEYKLDSLVYANGEGQNIDKLCEKDVEIKLKKEAHIYTHFSGDEADSIVTIKQYEYDRYHNVTSYHNLGDVSTDKDDLNATITYKEATSEVSKRHNLVSLPAQVLITAAGATGRVYKAQYNDFGDLVTYTKTDASEEDSIVTKYFYNEFGLLSRCIFPPNNKEHKSVLDIAYDDYSHTLPSSIQDHFGRISYIQHHHFWQKPTSIIDPNWTELRYTYDNIGRLQMVHTWLDSTEMVTTNMWGQNYTYEVPMATIKYTYIPCMQLRRENPYVHTTAIARYEGGVSDTLFSIHEYDRRGRLLQQKERREQGWRVKDIAATDCFGRIVKEYRPFITDSDTTALYSNNLQLHSTTSYDVLDRPTQISWQDNTYQTLVYDITRDIQGTKRLRQMHIDEAGHVRQQYTAPQGWTTASITPDGFATTFEYDALGQLLESTDPDSITTTHLYDAFGNRIQRTHPDAGVTKWTYDLAGNIVTSATQQQISDNTYTEYEYVYDRLVSVVPLTNTELGITYKYDSTGRISKRTDITGTECFTYDPMGNVIQSNRLIAVPSEKQAYNFVTRYKYDIFGRIREIHLPDDSSIEYLYSNGLLSQIRSRNQYAAEDVNNQSAVSYKYYINNIVYDEYDRPISYEQGNYVTTSTFSPDRLWLTSKTIQNDNRVLNDMHFTYDAVGNITFVEQNADTAHWLGGPYMQEFQYDVQDRLIRADMLSEYWGLYSDYNLTYSPSGMVGLKSCEDMLWNYWYGYNAIDNKITNHQIRSVYDMDNDMTTFFMWDEAGRLEDIYRPCTGDLRHHWWNEAGQMTAMVDNGQCAFYGYDGNGERAYKLMGTAAINQYNAGQELFHMDLNDAVVYVNPYFTISTKNYTCHIFNGSQRIATEIGTKNLSTCIDTTEIGRERLSNVRAYMQSLFSTKIELNPDTGSTFMDIEGGVYDELQWYCMNDSVQWEVLLHCDSNMIYSLLLREDGAVDKRVGGSYFYHSDHLGGANWITDSVGRPVQFIHYMPFGEMWYNQQGSAYNERFKFTGKERDDETGYDFFGARYYASSLPLWLSVDPLADKYPYISPYAYCNWNPVKNIDPDGKWIQIVVGAVVSAAADVAMQVGMDMLDDKSFVQAISNVDMQSVAASAIAGAIGVGVVSKVSQAAKFYKLGKASTAIAKNIASVVGDVAGSVTSQEIIYGQVTGDHVKNDIIGGIVGNKIGNVKMNKIKNTSGYKAAVRQLDHAERVAIGSTRKSRVQAVENTQNVVENYGASTIQSASSIASKVTSSSLNESTKQNTNKQVE